MPSLIAPTLVDPANGDVLGATQLNAYVRYVEFLHGYITAGYEPFSGYAGAGSIAGAQVLWNGYFVYGGIAKLYNNFSGTADLLVAHDGGTLTLSGPFANPIDLAAAGGTFTVGNRYNAYLLATAFDTGGVSWAYMPQAQAYTYAAPTTFTDGVLSDAADFASLSNDLLYLNRLTQVPSGTFRATTSLTAGGGSWVTFWYGSFIYRGLNSLGVVAGNTFPNGTTTVELHITDDTGANDRTCATVVNGYLTTPYNLSTATPALTVGQRYIIYLRGNTTEPGLVAGLACHRLFIYGSRSLSPMPPRWLVKQVPYGSTHDPRLQYTSDAIALLRTLAEYQTILGVDYGIQYLSAAAVNAPYETHFDWRRNRKWRWLHYLPLGVGTSGSLVYETDTGANVSLPDTNNDASWNTLDLDSVDLLPPGMIYSVTGVISAYESPSSDS